jgi:hypothetical protein
MDEIREWIRASEAASADDARRDQRGRHDLDASRTKNRRVAFVMMGSGGSNPSCVTRNFCDLDAILPPHAKNKQARKLWPFRTPANVAHGDHWLAVQDRLFGTAIGWWIPPA